MLWVTMSMAWVGKSGVAHSLSSSVRRFSPVSTSRAEKGSSISRASGSTTRARANPTRCCIPPDSSLGYADSKPSSPIRSISLVALSWHWAGGMPLACRPTSTFFSTVSQGSSAKVWKTMATPGLAPVTGVPR